MLAQREENGEPGFAELDKIGEGDPGKRGPHQLVEAQTKEDVRALAKRRIAVS